MVSIPFIAGQWSLRVRLSLAWGSRVAFQSPSLRGSGRFRSARPAPTRISACFNPLHCGAVVASRDAARGGPTSGSFQSPSLRGSGRFASRPRREDARAGRFQSPSLRGSGRFLSCFPTKVLLLLKFQSPSLRGSGRFTSRKVPKPVIVTSCFNPLHCGAVVASSTFRRRDEFFTQLFQSPSLRGSGRFSCSGLLGGQPVIYVSIPFIAGQWSLLLLKSIGLGVLV